MIVKTILATGIVAVGLASAAGLANAGTGGQANRTGYLEFVDVVFNRGDVPASDRFFQADLVDHAPWPGQPADVAGFKAGLLDMRKSFPDLHVEIERTVSEDDMLVAHLRMSGSQLGSFLGKPATGKTFSIKAVDIVRMSNGRIAEHWGIIDTAAMAAQLGL